MGFEPYRIVKGNVANSVAVAKPKKHASWPTIPTEWPANVVLDDLPDFLRDDVPEKAPDSWTDPFGWRPPTKR